MHWLGLASRASAQPWDRSPVGFSPRTHVGVLLSYHIVYRHWTTFINRPRAEQCRWTQKQNQASCTIYLYIYTYYLPPQFGSRTTTLFFQPKRSLHDINMHKTVINRPRTRTTPRARSRSTPTLAYSYPLFSDTQMMMMMTRFLY